MVTAVTNMGRSGVSDWLMQRVSAVILLAYFLFVAFVLLGGVDYASWKALYSQRKSPWWNHDMVIISMGI